MTFQSPLDPSLSAGMSPGLEGFDEPTVAPPPDEAGDITATAPDLAASEPEPEPEPEPEQALFHWNGGACLCGACGANANTAVATGFDLVLQEPEYIFATPQPETNAVIEQDAAFLWRGGGGAGQPITLTYSFATSNLVAPDPYAAEYSALQGGRSNFTSTEQSAIQGILSLYSQVANITFQQVSYSAASSGWSDLVFGGSVALDAGSAVTYSWTYGSELASAHVFADQPYMASIGSATPVAGNFYYLALIHEIGHALGLKHSGDYNASGGGANPPYLGVDYPAVPDTTQYTVMSYNGYSGYGSLEPLSPQLLDVAAVQYLFGANTGYNAGNTTYTFSTSTQIKTIWDGGGTDTFDVSNFSAGVTINLNPGGFSSVGGTNNIAVAYGANIENATGGSGRDSVFGNLQDNILTGNAGDDLIDGQGGDDNLYGGLGNDHINGGGGLGASAGADRIFGGAGNDFLRAYGSASVLYGGDDNDYLEADIDSGVYGDAGKDNLFVHLASVAFGGDGEDRLHGMSEAAGAGNRLYGGAGSDYLYTFSDDTLFGDGDNDTLLGSAFNNTFYGGDGADTLGGRAGDDTLDGGVGADYLQGGVGDDVFYVDNPGDVVNESAGEGTDTVIIVGDWTFVDDDVENLIVGGSTVLSAYGGASANVLTGNDSNNGLSGGGGDDSIFGGGGNDTIYGGNGNDLIDGGAGVDMAYYALDHTQYAVTQIAADTFTVTALSGPEGTDTVTGVEYIMFADSVQPPPPGQGGVETTAGQPSGPPPPVSTPTSGADSLTGTIAGDAFDALAGDDTIVGLAGHDSLLGNDGNDSLDGGDNNDTLLGGAGLDSLFGGAHGDTLNGGLGADSMVGGLGNDYYLVEDAGDTVVELAGEGADRVDVYTSAAVNVGDYVENVEGMASGGVNVAAGAGAQTMYGYGFNDTLDGGADNDVLYGGGGNDLLRGGTGNDAFAGGAGSDTYVGGAGNDYYLVQDAGDVVVELAGEGNDRVDVYTSAAVNVGDHTDWIEGLAAGGVNITSGAGNQTLNGYGFNDTLNGGADNDVLYGGAGDDWLDGDSGTDAMFGGAGNDTYVVDGPGDGVVEGAGGGADTVRTALTGYALAANVEALVLTGTGGISGSGNAGDNVLTGNQGDNQLRGLASNDALNGLDGNDMLVGGAGADTLTGGLGNDYYIVEDAGDEIVELAGEGADRVDVYTSAAIDVGDHVENVEGMASGGVNVTAGAGAQTMYGYGFNDTLDGGADNDVLYGGGGNDLLRGGTGNDASNGGAGNDTYAGGAGNDYYLVQDAGDVIVELAGEGNDRVDVYTSVAVNVGDYTDWIEGLAAGGVNITSGAGSQTLNGYGFNDTLNGGADNDVLYGGGGNDMLVGAAGADTMIGGQGNDYYIVTDAGDVVLEAAGSGTERVDVHTSAAVNVGNYVENIEGMASGGVNTTAGAGGQTMYGYASADTLDGGADNDVLHGGGADDVLRGGADNDALYGGVGGDLLTGGAGNDGLYGGVGADTMAGGAGNDYYLVQDAGDVVVELAGEGNDRVDVYTSAAVNVGDHTDWIEGLAAGGVNITSGAGNQTLNGYGFNDTLNGGAGNDILNGGGGDDRFVFGPGIAGETDTVIGFVISGGDVIDLSGAGALAMGDLSILQAGGNALITLVSGAQITIQGVTAADLTPDEFAF